MKKKRGQPTTEIESLFKQFTFDSSLPYDFLSDMIQED